MRDSDKRMAPLSPMLLLARFRGFEVWCQKYNQFICEVWGNSIHLGSLGPGPCALRPYTLKPEILEGHLEGLGQEDGALVPDVVAGQVQPLQGCVSCKHMDPRKAASSSAGFDFCSLVHLGYPSQVQPLQRCVSCRAARPVSRGSDPT